MQESLSNTTRSKDLVIYGRRDTGLQFSESAGPSVCFFSSGVMWPSLIVMGNVPLWREESIMWVKAGTTDEAIV